MSQNPNPAIAIVGIDIGKNSFHIVGLDQRGAIVLPGYLSCCCYEISHRWQDRPK